MKLLIFALVIATGQCLDGRRARDVSELSLPQEDLGNGYDYPKPTINRPVIEPPRPRPPVFIPQPQPRPVYGPPPIQPRPTYTEPRPIYTEPTREYGPPPQQVYNPPPQVYNPPPQIYNPPPQVYNPPPQVYNPPPQPRPVYNPPVIPNPPPVVYNPPPIQTRPAYLPPQEPAPLPPVLQQIETKPIYSPPTIVKQTVVETKPIYSSPQVETFQASQNTGTSQDLFFPFWKFQGGNPNSNYPGSNNIGFPGGNYPNYPTFPHKFPFFSRLENSDSDSVGVNVLGSASTNVESDGYHYPIPSTQNLPLEQNLIDFRSIK